MSYEGTSKVRSVRLHHPWLRSCIYTAEMQNRIYAEPQPCRLCGVDHIFKTFHLNLDANGDVCVSEHVYTNMKANSMLGELSATKEVKPFPTAIDLGVQTQTGQYTVVSREHGSYGVPIVIAGRE